MLRRQRDNGAGITFSSLRLRALVHVMVANQSTVSGFCTINNLCLQRRLDDVTQQVAPIGQFRDMQ